MNKFIIQDPILILLILAPSCSSSAFVTFMYPPERVKIKSVSASLKCSSQFIDKLSGKTAKLLAKRALPLSGSPCAMVLKVSHQNSYVEIWLRHEGIKKMETHLTMVLKGSAKKSLRMIKPSGWEPHDFILVALQEGDHSRDTAM